MKKIITSSFLFLSLVAVVLIADSCRKEESPVTKPSSNPKADALSPALGAANTVLTLRGSGLGDIHSVVFEKDSISAEFNPIFNTDGSLIFRVPTEAIPGQQNIVFTNGKGIQFTVPFNVLGLPAIIDVSNYNFTTGTELTLTGKNLDDVSRVVLSGSTDEATIVSKTATTLIITMPATALYRATLDITNLAGTTATSQEFVSLTNNFKFFADGYENGEQDASWGDAGFVSNTEKRSGTSSFGKNFQKGNWHQMGFGWNGIANDNYKFLTFWIKGGSVPINFWILTQQTAGASDPFNNAPNKITVPANVWTYYKLPIGPLELWKNGSTFNQIGWRLQGPDAQDEKIYLDDVMLVK
jgi:IPT/TIG domain